MKKLSKANLLIWICHIGALIVLLAIYPKLPRIVPMHWGIDGNIDGYGGKGSLFVLYAVGVGGTFLFDFARKIDPKSKNYDKFNRPYEIFKLVFAIFMDGLVLVMARSRFNKNLKVSQIIVVAVGLMFAVIGNYMPKFKYNYTMGIKTPWTLASETVWEKTHRKSGALWVFGGIGIALSSFLKPKYSFALVMIITVVISAIPMVYSYFEFKREQENKDGE